MNKELLHYILFAAFIVLAMVVMSIWGWRIISGLAFYCIVAILIMCFDDVFVDSIKPVTLVKETLPVDTYDKVLYTEEDNIIHFKIEKA